MESKVQKLWRKSRVELWIQFTVESSNSPTNELIHHTVGEMTLQFSYFSVQYKTNLPSVSCSFSRDETKRHFWFGDDRSFFILITQLSPISSKNINVNLLDLKKTQHAYHAMCIQGARRSWGCCIHPIKALIQTSKQTLLHYKKPAVSFLPLNPLAIKLMLRSIVDILRNVQLIWVAEHLSAGGAWTWSSGLSEYRRWASGEPRSTGDCVSISSHGKRMSTQSCSDRFPFICFRDNLVLVKENKTWEAALEHCRSLELYDQNNFRYDLVSVQPGDDHTYVKSRLEEAITERVWNSATW